MAKVVTVNRLKPLIERIERLEAEKVEISEMVRATYAEAKKEGFDVAAMKKLISERRKKPSAISEEEKTLQLYRDAVS